MQVDAERQADRFGAHLLVRAGFDLQKARSFLERIQTYRSRVTTAEFARSHPSDQERLAALDRIVRETQEKRERTNPVP
jgi:predicted Zn-dependent protease